MKNISAIALLFFVQAVNGQELFVFSEPASNMPAKSMSALVAARFPDSKYNNYFKQRYTPELMFGISKSLMVHGSATFSDFYTQRLSWESARLYAKWRFYSNDDIHRHFRLAAFASGAYSRSPFIYDEINLNGDNSGLEGGLIATQLINKLALSFTGSFLKVYDNDSQHTGHDGAGKEAINYSFSAGYLLFPRKYTNYNQPNLNLYMEVLGMRGLKSGHQMVDLAPALQLILNSNLKINAGYRFQLSGNMLRVGQRSFVLSVERTFLNALRK